jgi:hypothetical protein
MFEVYHAHHTKVKRDVAIQLLPERPLDVPVLSRSREKDLHSALPTSVSAKG